MTTIPEGTLTFFFPDGCEASKYDKWAFYQERFQSVAGGSKAADFICLADGVAWLIEVKDYRQHPRTKPSNLGYEVAVKIRDALSGLATAYANADDGAEKDFAHRANGRVESRAASGTARWRHAASPESDQPGLVSLRLRQKLKAVDPNPVVMNKGVPANVPWSVQ